MEKLRVISGSANRGLSEEIAKTIGIKLTPTEIKRFSDGEIYVRIMESVRGADVFVIQPTSPDANLNLMELLITIDAIKRSSPQRITAIMPYYGYARQDRKNKPREPITAKLVAKLLEAAGVGRVITIDLHVAQVQGFFDVHSDNLDIIPICVEHILRRKLKNIVFVAPDVGGAQRVRTVAKVMHAPIAIIDKRRSEDSGKALIEHVIGEIKGKTCMMVDDMIDTAGTITEAASLLKRKGAKEVYVYATHAVLSGSAIEKLKKSPIKEIVLTNTIEIPKKKRISKIKIISIAPLLAEIIKRSHEGTPMGVFYENMYKKLDKVLKQ
jgi:ribose-phosphate pyrophosphokinase